MKLLLLLFFLNKNKAVLDTPINKTNYFIAMQYKGMSNCIYKVFITDDMIMCARVNGYITVSPSFGLGTVIPDSLRKFPEAYVNKKLAAKYQHTPADVDAFLAADNKNFVIKANNISKIYHDPSKKWGMGPYPHTGKIKIVSKEKIDYDEVMVTTELILVGNQDPEEILMNLKKLNPQK